MPKKIFGYDPKTGNGEWYFDEIPVGFSHTDPALDKVIVEPEVADVDVSSEEPTIEDAPRSRRGRPRATDPADELK